VVDLAFTNINFSEGMTLRHRPGVKVLVTTGDTSRLANIPQTSDSLLEPYTGPDLVDRIKQPLGTKAAQTQRVEPALPCRLAYQAIGEATTRGYRRCRQFGSE
jgi:hypothetical protein